MQTFTGHFYVNENMFTLQNQILFLAALTPIIAIINDRRKKMKENMKKCDQWIKP